MGLDEIMIENQERLTARKYNEMQDKLREHRRNTLLFGAVTLFSTTFGGGAIGYEPSIDLSVIEGMTYGAGIGTLASLTGLGIGEVYHRIRK